MPVTPTLVEQNSRVLLPARIHIEDDDGAPFPVGIGRRGVHARGTVGTEIEVATVGDALSTAESRVPPEAPQFAGLVRVAAQDYLARRAPFGGC